MVRHDQCSPCRKISNHDPLRARRWMKANFWKKWGSSPQNESRKKYSQSELRLVNWTSVAFKTCLLCIFIVYVPWILLVGTTRVGRLGTTLGLLVGLRMLLPGRFSEYPNRTLSVPPKLSATHQVCDKIISCDDASKIFKVDSKGGNEAGKRSTYH
jgi:hypothetical protein